MHRCPGERRGFDGLGYVHMEGDGTTGTDVDYPIDSPAARAVIERFAGTYCEESPGGGLHVLALGGARNRRNGYEIYGSGRYLTFTGRHIPGTARELTPQQDAINWFTDTSSGAMALVTLRLAAEMITLVIALYAPLFVRPHA